MRRVHKYNAFTLVLTVTRGQIWPKEFQSRLPRSSKAGLASRYVAILSWNLALVIVRRTHTKDCGYSFSSNTRTLPVHSLPGMKASFHYETLVVYVTCLGRLCISSSRLVLSASKWAKSMSSWVQISPSHPFSTRRIVYYLEQCYVMLLHKTMWCILKTVVSAHKQCNKILLCGVLAFQDLQYFTYK